MHMRVTSYDVHYKPTFRPHWGDTVEANTFHADELVPQMKYAPLPPSKQPKRGVPRLPVLHIQTIEVL